MGKPYQKLFFLFSILLLLLEKHQSNARDVVGEVQINKDSCWDEGYVDYLPSAALCQLHCTLKENCNSWSYLHTSIRRCHLCSWTSPRVDVPCDTDTPCKTWGRREEGVVDAASLLNRAIQDANQVCAGTLGSDDALSAAQDANVIINMYADGDFDSDDGFLNNLSTAATNAARILRRENFACRSNYTAPIHSCNYGSLLLHQLRALLLNVDNGKGNRAFPTKLNKLRRKLVNKYGIFLADNNWMNKLTVRRLVTFYMQLPSHMSTEGILYDAKYAIQTVKDAWNCNGSFPGNLHTSNRGFNVFKTQVGQSYEQAFPSDTPDRPSAFDLQLTVTRHEVAHQFDRIIYNRGTNGDSRLFDMKLMLKEASKGDDDNWLRSQVGDAFFQGAPQEIIASHVGNQYLASSSSQLRLAVSRLTQDSGWTPLTYSTVTEAIATMTREKSSCSSQSSNLGEFDTAQECVDAAMNDNSCSYEIMYSTEYPSWGCRCCSSFVDISCPSEDALYTSHDLWDIYQFRNTEEEPSCDGTGIPLSWFLFNVDLFTPVSSDITTLYENEVNGQVVPVQALISRDASTHGITSIDIPFCGLITFDYDNNGIVNSVSENASSCTFTCKNDASFRIVRKNGAEKSCNWVGLNPTSRCKMRGKDGRIASNVCLASCKKCS